MKIKIKTQRIFELKKRLKPLMIYGDNIKTYGSTIIIETPVDDRRLMEQVMEQTKEEEQILTIRSNYGKLYERTKHTFTELDSKSGFENEIERYMKRKWGI